MTSKNYSNKSHFQNLWKQFQWIALMSFVVIGFTTTVPAIAQILDIGLKNGAPSSSTYSAEYLFRYNRNLPTAIPFLAFISALSLFKFINQKAEVDFYFSTPLTKNTMFFSRYLLGILACLIPLFLHGLLTLGLASIIPMRNTPSLAAFFQQYFHIAASYLSIYTLAIMGSILTGNFFMAVTVSVGLSLTPSAFCYLAYLFARENFRHFSGNADFATQINQYTSPFPSVFVYEPSENTIVPFFLLQTLVSLAIAYHSFQTRPTENAGSPVAMPSWKPLIKCLGVFCGSAIIGLIFSMGYEFSSPTFLVTSFLSGLVLHMAFEILFDMDVNAWKKNLKHFVALYGVLAISSLCFTYDVFQYDNKQTPLESISAISFNGMTLTEPENLKIIHTMISESIANPSHDYDLEDGEVTLQGITTIHPKTGNDYNRHYRNSVVKYEDYASLVTSEEYFIQTHNYNLTEADWADMEKTLENKAYWAGIFSGYTSSAPELSLDQLKEIYPLLLKEIDTLTPDYLMTHSPVTFIRYNGNDYRTMLFPVYPIQEEALALLPPATKQEITADVNVYENNGTPGDALHSLPFALQTAILEEMTATMIPYHISYETSKGYNVYGSTVKDYVSVERYDQLYGYLSRETYEELVATYGETQSDSNTDTQSDNEIDS